MRDRRHIDLRSTTPAALSQLILWKLGIVLKQAVFIDGDWLLFTASSNSITIDFPALFAKLRELFGANVGLSLHLGEESVWWRSRLHRGRGPAAFARFVEGIEAMGCAVDALSRGPGRGLYRKGIDVRLAVAATALPPGIQTLALVSGDSDFLPLIGQARASGRTTVLIADTNSTAVALREAADRFIGLREIIPGWPA